MASPTHVMVRSTSPRANGQFRRAHLDFTHDWRALELGKDVDEPTDAPRRRGGNRYTDEALGRLQRGIIGPDTLKRLEAEKMLAVKPATAAEVEEHKALIASAGAGDKDAQIAALLARTAELEARLMKVELGEARLMKVELGAKGGGGGEKKKDEGGAKP